MNLIEAIGDLAANLFTDRRIYGKPAKYVRKDGSEIDIIVTSYHSGENAVFRFTAIHVQIHELLVRTETLCVNGKMFTPKQDDRILIEEKSFRVMNGEHRKPYRYLDATECMMIITTQRFGECSQRDLEDDLNTIKKRSCD